MHDIVIVGGGAAGAVVAARASENPGLDVLLIEAGPDYESASTLPEDLVDGHRNSLVDHDWAYEYRPVPGGRTVHFPRGRVVGGSTAVNTTIALRGVPADYNHWADLGNPEWAWDRVLPAFNRLERDLDFGAEPHHGDAGPITVRRWQPDELVPTQAAFLEAATASPAAGGLGHPVCADVNAPDAVGAGPMAMNKLGRARISTAVGYLAPARIRENLTIEADTTAARVVTEAGRAVGVEVIGPDGQRSVRRGRLVVVACGAVATPGVLVRSGIGASDELAELGIDPVATMAGVGANLSDHPALLVAMTARFGEFCAEELPLVQTITRYTSDGGGSDGPVELDVNIELITRIPRPSGRPDRAPVFGLAASLEWVEGRGRIRQRSSDPASKPEVDPGFGVHPADVARNVAAYRDALAMTRHPALADLIDEVVFPDPSRSTDDDLRALAAKASGSGYHPCGTARMGPVGDPGAVVDQYGRCHGV